MVISFHCTSGRNIAAWGSESAVQKSVEYFTSQQVKLEFIAKSGGPNICKAYFLSRMFASNAAVTM